MRRPSFALSVATICLSCWFINGRSANGQVGAMNDPTHEIIPFVDEDPWLATAPPVARATPDSDTELSQPVGENPTFDYDGPAYEYSYDDADDYEADPRYYEQDEAAYGDEYEYDEREYEYDEYDEYGHDDEYEYEYEYDGRDEEMYAGEAEPNDAYAGGYEEGDDYDYDYDYYYGDVQDEQDDLDDVTYEPEAPVAPLVYEPAEYALDYRNMDEPLPYEATEADYEPAVYALDYRDMERPLPYEIAERDESGVLYDDLACRLIDTRDRFYAWLCEQSWAPSIAGSYDVALQVAVEFAEAIGPMVEAVPVVEERAVASRVADDTNRDVFLPEPGMEECDAFDQVQDWQHETAGDLVAEPGEGAAIGRRDVVIGAALLLDRIGERLQQISREMLVRAAH